MIPVPKRKLGFTLIELMIVVAIIGTLAAIAIPQYSDYISKTRASGAMTEIDSIKSAIGVCYSDLGTFIGCNADFNGIPTLTVTKNIITVGSVINGVITTTSGATTSAGVNLTIIDTPTVMAGTANIAWENTGTICNAMRGMSSGYGDCP